MKQDELELRGMMADGWRIADMPLSQVAEVARGLGLLVLAATLEAALAGTKDVSGMHAPE